MGCAVAGSCSSAIFDGLREAAQGAQALLVVRPPVRACGGERAVEEEVGDFFELAVSG